MRLPISLEKDGQLMILCLWCQKASMPWLSCDHFEKMLRQSPPGHNAIVMS